MKISVGMARPPRRLVAATVGTAARKHQPCPQGGSGDLPVRRRAACLAPADSPAAAGEPGRDRHPGPSVPPCPAGAQPLALFPMMPVMGDLTRVIAKPQIRPTIVKEQS
jgi:hypothetical protein